MPNQEQIKEYIFEAFGKVSALFMSQEVKGTEIIMPSEEIRNIGYELLVKISNLSKSQVEQKEEENAEEITTPFTSDNN